MESCTGQREVLDSLCGLWVKEGERLYFWVTVTLGKSLPRVQSLSRASGHISGLNGFAFQGGHFLPLL
jgi:hypothetical protein